MGVVRAVRAGFWTVAMTGLPSVFSVVRTRESVLMICGCTRTWMEKEEKKEGGVLLLYFALASNCTDPPGKKEKIKLS